MLEFKAHFKSVQPDLGGSLPGDLIFGIPGKDGGYYLVAAEQVDANTIRFTFTPSQKEMPKVDPVDITLPNATGAGLTTAQINALDGMFKVCAFTKPDVSAEYNAFKTAFGIGGEVEPDIPDVPDEPDVPEKTLTGISAVYSGGSVVVGTAVNDLTGIVITAHYSDGSTETVTGYTLSGTIAEGSNTITVSYGGKTATFTVTGVAESGGGETVTVLFTSLEQKVGIMQVSGTATTTSGARHVQFAYVEGMLVSCKLNDAWITNGFSPVIVYDNGVYTAHNGEKTAADGTVGTYQVTLTGYSGTAVVYANIKNAISDDNYYSYES